MSPLQPSTKRKTRSYPREFFVSLSVRDLQTEPALETPSVADRAKARDIAARLRASDDLIVKGQRGSLTVPRAIARSVLDLIDAHYGPTTDAMPDGYHHTDKDTLDKISAHSLQISGDIFLEMIRLINQRP